MASTSTNKQPLLIDRPLHIQQNITSQKTGVDSPGIWLSNNSCSLFLDCTQNDGALIEDLYVLSKESTQHTILFFMSNTSDTLRESDIKAFNNPLTVDADNNVVDKNYIEWL